MNRILLLPLVSLSALASLALGACSSADAPAAGTTSSSSGSSSTSTSTSSSSSGASSSSSSSSSSTSSSGAGGGPVCPPPGVKGNGVAVNVGTVDATVLDPSDMPVPSLLAQVCGINICINGKTGANGHVIVNVNGQSLTQPAFKYGEGYTFARFAQPLPTMTPIVIPVAVTVALPAAGVDFAAGKDSVSGGVTLSIPVGGTFEVDTLTYDMPDQQLFRAAEIPIAKAPAAVDPALNLEILYGVGPVETTFCPPAAVTVPNTPAWPAGTAVEFYVHGVDVSEDYAPYGGWAKVSDGAVSADGKTVSTAAAGGLPVLSAFGVRKKP